MAQRRLLNRSLGTSKKFYQLNDRAGNLADFCQALFPLIMASADDHGRLAADAFSVKMNVFPVSRHSIEDFEAALQALNAEKLINLYEADGSRYLYVVNFRREQPGIKYIASALYPDPPAEVNKTESFTGIHQDSPGPASPGDDKEKEKESNIKKKKETEEKRRETSSHAAGAAAVNQLPSVESCQLSERLRKAIQVRDPNAKAAKLPDTTRWAQDIDKLLHVDGRKMEDCEAVIDWCQKDAFWGPNILSGRKLREKFDTLWGQMHRGNGNNARRPASGIGANPPSAGKEDLEKQHRKYEEFILAKPENKRKPDEIKFLLFRKQQRNVGGGG